MKAARGAGFSWGLAEEAGAAATWLVQHGIDGPALLLQRLTIGPLAGPTLPWSSQHHLQCPISLGAALCDHVDLPQTNLQAGPIELGPVATPELLLPFLSRMAKKKGHALKFTDNGRDMVLSDDGRVAIATAEKQSEAQPKARISYAGALDHADAFDVCCGISAQTIKNLNVFAMRTTVPTSEASRAGAGALDRNGD